MPYPKDNSNTLILFFFLILHNLLKAIDQHCAANEPKSTSFFRSDSRLILVCMDKAKQKLVKVWMKHKNVITAAGVQR